MSGGVSATSSEVVGVVVVVETVVTAVVSVGFSDELFCSSFLLHEQNAQRHNAHRAIIIFLFICSPPFL